jgi:hypothetical protein
MGATQPPVQLGGPGRGATPPFPQYAFMAWCLVKRRDNFTFHLIFLIISSVSFLCSFNVYFLHFLRWSALFVARFNVVFCYSVCRSRFTDFRICHFVFAPQDKLYLTCVSLQLATWRPCKALLAKPSFVSC